MDAHSLECLDFVRIRELLASHAMCSLGRQLCLTVQPIGRRELVQRWFNQVLELGKLAESRGMPPMGGVTDVREAVKNCAPPLRVSVEDVAAIRDTLRGTHAVARYLADLPEAFAELNYLATRIGDFNALAERIDAVIDERGHVRDNASSKLARIRSEIERASREIRSTIDRLLQDASVRRLLQYPNHTFHNDRLVLPLRAECRGRLTGIVHRTSDSGMTIYVEPAQAVELNNEISNLRAEETEEINRLLWELTHEIYINHEAITKTLDALAVLDLVIAKHRFARRYELTCPELVDDNVIHVRQARHPLLLEYTRAKREAGENAEDIVPVDYRLGDDFDLLIVTGPNTGGKTVTLKTVGLLALMAQSGMPIPAAPGSRMGLFSNVLIDIGDEQSMQQSLSTFSGHMKRLLDMLKRAGPKTLVLIDELGAGTDPDEGAAIGRAILDELLRLRCRCVVTTHIGALKGFALTRERAENGSVEFNIETLRPSYHLHIGEAGSSCAIEIAQRLGMPKRLVGAARRNLSHRARAMRTVLAGAADVKRKAEAARQDAETARAAAKLTQAEAEEMRVRLEKQREAFDEWMRRVAHLKPGDVVRLRGFDRDGKIVRMRLDQQRAEVDVGAFTVEAPLGEIMPPQTIAPPPPPKPAPAPKREAPRKPARQPKPQAPPSPKPTSSAPAEPKLPALTEKQAASLRPGDRVYAKRFHREGVVVRVNAARKEVVVSVGLLEVEVPYDGLSLPGAVRQADLPRRSKQGAARESGKPAADAPPSDDVNGAGIKDV